MIKQSRGATSAERKVTFVLPAGEPAGTVSVVGDFNDWTPGRHILRKRSNGTRSVAITVPAGATVKFRYLGEGGYWFDDTHAHALTDEGGLVQVRDV
ncbi:MAG: isoamylase [Micrococcales bacterium]|nr:MAG: isoamylase [Micrococcales bacterium]PIE26866.1 MAG: isoamylase [Micrococcales bacterium]